MFSGGFADFALLVLAAIKWGIWGHTPTEEGSTAVANNGSIMDVIVGDVVAHLTRNFANEFRSLPFWFLGLGIIFRGRVASNVIFRIGPLQSPGRRCRRPKAPSWGVSKSARGQHDTLCKHWQWSGIFSDGFPGTSTTAPSPLLQTVLSLVFVLLRKEKVLKRESRAPSAEDLAFFSFSRIWIGICPCNYQRMVDGRN